MAVITLLAGLAGCAPGRPAETTPPSAPAAASASAAIDWSKYAGQTITYVYYTDGPDEQTTRNRIAEFTELTGVNVNLQIVPYDDLEQTMQARLSAGDAPEVARVGEISPYLDVLLDLRQYLGADYASEFLAGPMSWGLGPNGEVFGVPDTLTMTAPFVNVDQFEKAGVALPTADDPWTFDELVDNAKKVQEANQTEFALAIDKSGHRVSALLSEYGTVLINEQGQESLDAAKAETVFTKLADLMKDGTMSKDFWLDSGSKYKGANDMFLAQAVPVYLSGSWQVGQFAQNATFNWAAIPNVKVERGGGMPGGELTVAFRTSKLPEAAAGFVEFLNSTEEQQKQDLEANWLPSRNDLIATGIQYPARADDMNVFIKELAITPADTYADSTSAGFTPGANEIVKQIGNLVAEQTDAATAVASVKQVTADAIAESQ
jgi:alpha-1,4-digalacturonate transport system substrate-binding protein